VKAHSANQGNKGDEDWRAILFGDAPGREKRRSTKKKTKEHSTHLAAERFNLCPKKGRERQFVASRTPRGQQERETGGGERLYQNTLRKGVKEESFPGPRSVNRGRVASFRWGLDGIGTVTKIENKNGQATSRIYTSRSRKIKQHFTWHDQ